MLLEPRFKRRGRGAIYNNRRKRIPEGNNVNKKRCFMGNIPEIGSEKGFVVVKTRGGMGVGGKGSGRNARLMV